MGKGFLAVLGLLSIGPGLAQAQYGYYYQPYPSAPSYYGYNYYQGYNYAPNYYYVPRSAPQPQFVPTETVSVTPPRLVN